MSRRHLDLVRREFTKQAKAYGGDGLTVTSSTEMRWVLDNIAHGRDDVVLDVAAGTGHLSMALAPGVSRVVAIDATAAMLKEGQKAAAQAGFTNVAFQLGDAEALPHPNDSFDLVVCRFAVHHFERPLAVIQEMVRACRTNGRVIVIDIISPNELMLAASYNRLERARDPSHTRCLTAAELTAAFTEAGLDIAETAFRWIDVDVESWLALTRTAAPTAAKIRRELLSELEGGPATGMQPFRSDGTLKFRQRLMIVAGLKMPG